MPYEGVPGLVETREAYGETTLVVDPARLEEACQHLRDEEGFSLLLDIVATDYLGWGEDGVAGYYGTAAGRNLNEPAAQGYSHSPEPKPKRFSLSYLLIRVADDTTRVRVQVWLDDGQAVATVVPVWPTADWYEREAFDMMGALSRAGLDMSSYMQVATQWGQKLATDATLSAKFSQMMQT